MKKISPHYLRSGFSVMELAVAIGVLLILAALLLPAFRLTRAEGQRVKCAANLRQAGVLFALYATDHRGTLPMARRDFTDAQGKAQVEVWFRLLFPYAGGMTRDADHAWLNCPARESTEPYNYSYAMDRSAGSDTVDHTGAIVKLSDLQQNLHLGKPVNGERWLLLDALWYFIDQTKGLNTLSGAHYTPLFRHRERLNVLMADFSVRTLSAKEMNETLYIYRDKPLP